MQILDGVENRISERKSHRHLLNELKKIQREFKKTKFTRKDQSAVWDKLDGLFKEIKSKKYGKTASGNDPLIRILRRIDGLTAAIDRMERSFEEIKKISTSKITISITPMDNWKLKSERQNFLCSKSESAQKKTSYRICTRLWLNLKHVPKNLKKERKKKKRKKSGKK